jgi:hypothetical protein
LNAGQHKVGGIENPSKNVKHLTRHYSGWPADVEQWYGDGAMTLNIVTFSIKTFLIMTFSMTTRKCDNLHNDTQNIDIEC